MEQILQGVGLSDNEIAVYLLTLKTPHLTAQEIADHTGIKRTNVYRLLDSLVEMELIVFEENPIKRFTPAEPQALHKLLQQKQSALKQTASSLSTVMPSLRSQYSLALNKPGVVHMTGEDGLERLLLDMAHSQTEVLLIAGDEPQQDDVREKFQQLILERKANGIHTRSLYHTGPHKDAVKNKFTERGFDVRFIGTTPFESEVLVYEDNVVFSVYDPALIITVITNPAFASTMRTIFEQLWGQSKN